MNDAEWQMSNAATSTSSSMAETLSQWNSYGIFAFEQPDQHLSHSIRSLSIIKYLLDTIF